MFMTFPHWLLVMKALLVMKTLPGANGPHWRRDGDSRAAVHMMSNLKRSSDAARQALDTSMLVSLSRVVFQHI
jgi:hypothetical protein